MEYDNDTQKMINRMGTVMICYMLAVLVTIFMRGWEPFDLICLAIDVLIFVMFQFLHLNKKIICILCLILGIFSFFSLAGLAILIISLLMAVYSIILFIKINKNKY